MKTLLLILTCLASQIACQCGNGCLRCSIENTCLLCDPLSNYYLQGNTCVPSTQANCQVLSMNNSCLLCNKGFYLDLITFSCVAIPVTSVVSECVQYNSNIVCQLCNTGFYLSQGLCVKATTLKDNCLYYIYDGLCLVCKDGYIFSNTFDSCVAQPTGGNCRYYTYLQCQLCKEGYYFNRNLYLSQMKTPEAMSNFIYQPLLSITSRQWLVMNVCEPKFVANCILYDLSRVCTACASGYYLQDKLCNANPASTIQFCYEFSDASTCKSCVSGYYLSSNACVAVTAKAGCIQYDFPSATATPQCKRCGENFYISSGSCSQRTKTLAMFLYCAALQPSADTCGECITGYDLNNPHNTKCLPKPKNCLAYQVNASTDNAFKCTACFEGHYIVTEGSNKGCVRGKIPFCQAHAFSNSVETCTQCRPGYYLQNNGCHPHINIDNCLSYDNSNMNTCSECPNNYFLLKMDTVCSALGLVHNCRAYDDKGTSCVQCVDNYYLTYAGDCKLIPPESNCQSMSQLGQCTACKASFALFQGQCLPFFEHVTQHCSEYSNGGVSSNLFEQEKCSKCSSPGYAYDPSHMALCVSSKLAHSLWQPYFVDHCERYRETNNKLACLECEPGYYLDDTWGSQDLSAVCIKSCKLSYKESILVLDNLDGKVNACMLKSSFDTTNQSMCKIFVRVARSPADNTVYRCITADVNFNMAKIFDLAFPNEVGLVYDLGSTSLYPTSMFHYGLNLLTPTSSNDQPTIVDNCQLYDKTKACIRCVFGYFLISRDVSGAVTSFCSVDGNACNVNVKYDGLPTYLDAFVSCHQCLPAASGDDRIPVVQLNTDDGQTKWASFIAATSNSERKFFGCQPSSDFTLSTAIPKCAIIGSIKPGSGNLFNSCLACIPGFKPTYSANYKVTACDAITNCQTTGNNLFNSCRKCAPASGTNFYAQEDSSLQTCIQVKGDNCFIASATNFDSTPNIKKCQICYPGYFLNSRGLCEQLLLPQCRSSLLSAMTFNDISNSDNAVSLQQARVYYMLSSIGRPNGCSLCPNNFLKVQASSAAPVCIKSSLLGSDAEFDAATSPIQYCRVYDGTSATPKCLQCTSASRLPSGDNTSCVSSTLQNCRKLSGTDGSQCGTCADNSILDSNLCVTIANCQTYDTNNNKCSTCKGGFYLSNNKKLCQPGTVENCAEFQENSDAVCTKCSPMFILINIGSNTFCFPAPSSLNCVSFNPISDTPNQKLSCNQCNTFSGGNFVLRSFFLTDEYRTGPRSLCLPVFPLSNCLTYRDKNSPGSFKCQVCKEGYYINNFVCASRAKWPIANCRGYHASQDACEQCNTNYFYSTTLGQCLPYPTGIQNCFAYTNPTTCEYCNEGFYLTANQQCLTSTAVQGCLIYDANNSCKQCKSTFFLKDKACVANTATTAKGCLTFVSDTECATCASGQGIQDTSGTKSCVSITLPANCAVTTKVHPFTCTICNQGYFLSGTTCTAVTPITNCLAYDSATTCTQCTTETQLSADRASCLAYKAIVDSNCAAFKLSSTPVCQACEEGYLFNAQGQCIKATSTENPDYRCIMEDEKKDNVFVCKFCIKGYYQDYKGICRQNEVAVAAISESVTPTAYGLAMSSKFIAWIWVMMVLAEVF